MTHKKRNLQKIVNDKTRITTYKNRKANLYKKALEFSTLCGVETCLLVYGPNTATDELISEPEIWPRDETKVLDIIKRYNDTVSNSCKKETHVEDFVIDTGKAEEIETNKRVQVKNKNKYCTWENKLDKCSREQLYGILCAVDNKLHEVMTRQERDMFRAHHQSMETPIPQSLVDQHYRQQYFSGQPRFNNGFPNEYNNIGFYLISPHEDQIQMENWTNLGLNQGLMMSKGNEMIERKAQSYYNREPSVQMSAAYTHVNQFLGYQVPLNIPWRLSGNQVEDN